MIVKTLVNMIKVQNECSVYNQHVVKEGTIHKIRPIV